MQKLQIFQNLKYFLWITIALTVSPFVLNLLGMDFSSQSSKLEGVALSTSISDEHFHNILARISSCVRKIGHWVLILKIKFALSNVVSHLSNTLSHANPRIPLVAVAVLATKF